MHTYNTTRLKARIISYLVLRLYIKRTYSVGNITRESVIYSLMQGTRESPVRTLIVP